MSNTSRVLRCIANVAPSGNVGVSAWFVGSVDDLKQLAAVYDCKPLYCVKLKSVKPGAPGYFEWFTLSLGVDFEHHGTA